MSRPQPMTMAQELARIRSRLDMLERRGRATSLRKVYPNGILAGSTIEPNGDITFDATSVTADGVFQPGTTRYLLLLEVDGVSNGSGIFCTMRAGGVSNTASLYTYSRNYNSASTPQSVASSAQQRFELGGATSQVTNQGVHMSRIEVVSANRATRTKLLYSTWTVGGSFVVVHGGGFHDSSTVFDGIQIFPGAGTFAGRLGIYAYE